MWKNEGTRGMEIQNARVLMGGPSVFEIMDVSFAAGEEPTQEAIPSAMVVIANRALQTFAVAFSHLLWLGHSH